MKLAEAAHILGISLEDVTVDILKQSYKKLVTTWDNDKIKDSSVKFRYLQINEAYQKLHSVMESKEEPPDDQHELANFMRMVMDIVGISDSNNIPSAAMTFGMMFGGDQNGEEDWSDEDLGQEENEDEEDDEEDEEDEESDQQSDDNDIWPALGDRTGQWEPPAKQYSNMNLKDQVCRARKESEMKSEMDALLENERRLKIAKKRAEKRKKQKEHRKLKEQSYELSPQNNQLTGHDRSSNQKGLIKSPEAIQFENMLAFASSAESIERIVNRQKDQHRHLLLESVQRGDVETVERLLQFNTQHENIPQSILESVHSAWKKEFTSYYLFHRCITDTYQFIQEDPDHSRDLIFDLLPEQTRLLITRKIQIAQIFASCKDPLIDLNAYDEQGLSILHKSILVGDIQFAKFVVATISSSSSSAAPNIDNSSSCSNNGTERRITINLNTRCRKKGWAPIHYAVDKFNVEAIRLLGYSGANLQATSATDKKLTPIELMKGKLRVQSKGSKQTTTAQEAPSEVISVLNELIAWQKSLVKEEKKKTMFEAEQTEPKQPESRSKSSPKSEVPPSSPATNMLSSAASSAPSSSSSAVKSQEKKKKKKKGDSNDSKPLTSSIASPTITPADSVAVAVKEKNNADLEVPLVSSRDEIMDRLLAMGFREAHCLMAISRYGTDIDQAISWLCEQPNDLAPKEPRTAKTSDTVKPKPADVSGGASIAANSGSSSAGATKPAQTVSKITNKKKETINKIASHSSNSTAAAPVSVSPTSAVIGEDPKKTNANANANAWQPKNNESEKKKEHWKRGSEDNQRGSPSGLAVSHPKTASSPNGTTGNSEILLKQEQQTASAFTSTGNTRAGGHPSRTPASTSSSSSSSALVNNDIPSLTAASTAASHLLPVYAYPNQQPPLNGMAYNTFPSAGPQMAAVYYAQPYGLNLTPAALPPGYSLSPAILLSGYPPNLPHVTAPYPMVQSSLMGPLVANATLPPPPNIVHPSHQPQHQSAENMDSLLNAYSVQPTLLPTRETAPEVSNVSMMQEDTEMFGALELSVGAKPFIPKTFSAPPNLPPPATSNSASVLSTTTPFSPLLSSFSALSSNSAAPSSLPNPADLLSNLGSASTPFLFDDLSNTKTSFDGNVFGGKSLVGSSDNWSLTGATRTLSPSNSLGNTASLGDSLGALGSTPLSGLGDGIGGLGYFSSSLFTGLNQQSVNSVGGGLHEAINFEFDVNRDILPELDSLLAKDLNDLTT